MTGSSEASIILNAPKDTPMGQINEVAIDTYDEIDEEMKTNPKTVMYMSYFESLRNPDYDSLLHFEEGVPSHVAIGLQPDSELRRCFDFHILQMMENGIVRKILDKWMLGKPKDMSHRIFVEEAQALGYDNLFFPATVLAAGCLVSLILSIFEKLLRFKK